MQRSTCKSWPVRWQRIGKVQEITEESETHRSAFCTTKAAKDLGLSPPAQKEKRYPHCYESLEIRKGLGIEKGISSLYYKREYMPVRAQNLDKTPRKKLASVIKWEMMVGAGGEFRHRKGEWLCWICTIRLPVSTARNDTDYSLSQTRQI